MHQPKVKICGITNLQDAEKAVELGADILGFNFFAESPRYLTAKQAQKIINKLPAYVDTAGIFVNETVPNIHSIAGDCNLNWIQLHGDETPGLCAQLESASAQIIKALRIRDHRDVEYARNFSTDALLLDAYDRRLYGGTGKRLDWEKLPEMVKHIYGRIFLAGGIRPDHVERIWQLGFFGIDICSGVESEPGKKDHKKLELLFDNIMKVKNS